jgi:uncharacterized protein (DUF1015 family)
MTAVDHVPSDSSIPSPGGLVLAPFRALRYATTEPRHLARLLSPPYDVIDPASRTALEEADPHNFVRLILPRDDRGGGLSRYQRAARTLEEWRSTGVLVTDREQSLYIYEMASGGTVTRGLLGAAALAAPEAGIILPHENTMTGTVSDRLALTEATAANLEPIYLVYDGGGAASSVVAEVDSREPEMQATTEDGIRHRLWSVTDPEALAAVAADLLPRHALIADGHHRYATYLAYQADRHARGDGPGPWDFGLVYLVDARAFGPRVEAIHRVIAGLPLDQAVRAASAAFTVTRLEPEPDSALQALADAGRDGPAFVLSDGDRWHLLTRPDPAQLAAAVPDDHAPAWRELDVTVAHRLLIGQLWRLDDREGIVDFEHDLKAALATARAAGGTALILRPTPVDQVAAVAAAGERMPRKSTLFTPKPRSGLVLRRYDAS